MVTERIAAMLERSNMTNDEINRALECLTAPCNNEERDAAEYITQVVEMLQERHTDDDGRTRGTWLLFVDWTGALTTDDAESYDGCPTITSEDCGDNCAEAVGEHYAARFVEESEEVRSQLRSEQDARSGDPDNAHHVHEWHHERSRLTGTPSRVCHECWTREVYHED